MYYLKKHYINVYVCLLLKFMKNRRQLVCRMKNVKILLKRLVVKQILVTESILPFNKFNMFYI